jgi:hypothetical protein
MRLSFTISFGFCTSLATVVRDSYEDELDGLFGVIKPGKISADNYVEGHIDAYVINRIAHILEEVPPPKQRNLLLSLGESCFVVESVDPQSTLLKLYQKFKSRPSHDWRYSCLAWMAFIAERLSDSVDGGGVYSIDWQERISSRISGIQPAVRTPTGCLTGKIEVVILSRLIGARDDIMALAGIDRLDPEHYGEVSEERDPVLALNAMLDRLKQSDNIQQKIWYLNEMGALANTLKESGDRNGTYFICPEENVQG